MRRKGTGRATAGMLVALLLSGGPARAVPEAREVRMVADGCPVALELRGATLRFRDDCPDGQAAKLARFARLVRELGGVPPAVTSVALGRLALTFPEMARTVALAAARRPAAEIARGFAGPDHGNRLYVALLDASDALAPLRAALVAEGLRPGAASVEKVLRLPARDTPFAAWLAGEGVAPGRVVPFDAQVWVRVAR